MYYPLSDVYLVSLGLAKRVKARFLLASTSEVYGGKKVLIFVIKILQGVSVTDPEVGAAAIATCCSGVVVVCRFTLRWSLTGVMLILSVHEHVMMKARELLRL